MEMTERPQWIVWKYEFVGGRWTKVLYQPKRHRSKAKTNDPSTWSSFDEALAAYDNGGFDGIGYVFSADDPYFGVDVDNCLRAGQVLDWATPILEKLEPTYGEISPSGNGVKFIAKGELPSDRGTRRAGMGPDGSGALEVYDRLRFFTITGDVFGDSTTIAELPDVAVELYALAKEKPPKATKAGKSRFTATATNSQAPASSASNGVHTDAQVLEAAARADGFNALWGGSLNGHPSQSEADMALINRLAFYCGRGQEEQVKRLFLQSELGKRSKSTGRDDYLDKMTIPKAYQGRTEFYDWTRPSANGKAQDSRPAFSNAFKVESPGKKPDEVRTEFKPRSAPEIAGYLTTIAKGWPKRLEETLFVQSGDFRPVFLESSTQLFSFIDSFASVFWQGGPDMVTQERFHEYVRKFKAQRFRAIERFPHWPPMPETYYMHPAIQPTRSRTLLDRFLDFFDFASDVDRSLGEAALLTLFWGGSPGARPCFLIRGPEDDDPVLMGRYVGKTTFVEVIASLVDGLVDILEGEDIPAVKTRLLSDEGMSKRVLRMDNLKTTRMGWAPFESFITSDVISGHRLFRGEGSRPNTVTPFITMNGGSLSKDMATRSIAIRLKRPRQHATWRSDVAGFIVKNQWGLVAEILGLLSEPRDAGSIVPRGRWAEWQGGVLGKVAAYEDCQDEIDRRCAELDADDESAETFETIIREKLIDRYHEPDNESIKIPTSIMGVWYSQIQKAHVAAKTATERLQLMPLKRLKWRRTNSERFWLWSGKDATGPLVDLKSELFTTKTSAGPHWGE
jgi:hypothetical protein